MDFSRLIAHARPDAVLAYRQESRISAGQFLADVRLLADALPHGRHVLNVCQDRYRFTVGLAASLVSGRVSLLPSTHTPEVIRQLALIAPDVVCLTDEQACAIDLPRYLYPHDMHGTDRIWSVPSIAAEQLAAIVFTSGSTGTPLPYPKTWGKLVRCVLCGAPRLGLLDGRSHALVGTVPAQHMYGFESTVLLPLLTGNALYAARPFYPADIADALSAVPRPRALVSTPVHLRALLAAGVDLPTIDWVLSATAPLPVDVARDVETRFGTRLLEIYGSTETGQIATRQPTNSSAWHLWPEVRLKTGTDGMIADGGHIEQPTTLCDVLELLPDDRFLLHGRSVDLVNVAGKRSSFAYLDSQLTAIPGVLDGVFFLKESDGGQTGVARLAAIVVAPTLSTVQITEALRARVDPVFLPRPLVRTDKLPRNATGKLPRHELLAMLERHERASSSQ